MAALLWVLAVCLWIHPLSILAFTFHSVEGFKLVREILLDRWEGNEMLRQRGEILLDAKKDYKVHLCRYGCAGTPVRGWTRRSNFLQMLDGGRWRSCIAYSSVLRYVDVLCCTFYVLCSVFCVPHGRPQNEALCFVSVSAVGTNGGRGNTGVGNMGIRHPYLYLCQWGRVRREVRSTRGHIELAAHRVDASGPNNERRNTWGAPTPKERWAATRPGAAWLANWPDAARKHGNRERDQSPQVEVGRVKDSETQTNKIATLGRAVTEIPAGEAGSLLWHR
ncbi:hypothetical protein B0H17DRAFT_1176815 [Mycena rosella]|uniref:Uncharacterized protein n=1 Tax=Mycena rosella TaxID=1033263 RepID=A0AAD7GQ36_MYCRO|nr:hypothetical protein B0H17DRAFT_1176815 [Mycena rosella]